MNCCPTGLKTENLYQYGNFTKSFPCTKKRKSKSFVRKKLVGKNGMHQSLETNITKLYVCARKQRKIVVQY